MDATPFVPAGQFKLELFIQIPLVLQSVKSTIFHSQGLVEDRTHLTYILIFESLAHSLLANYVLTIVIDTEGRTQSQQQEINRRKSRQMANVRQGRVGSEQQVCWQRRQMQHQEVGWQQTELILGRSGNR